MDPPEPVPATSDYAMLGELTPDAIDALVQVAGHESGSPLLSVELRPLGGALGRPYEDHGARGTFDASYVLFGVGMALSPEMKAAVHMHAAAVVETMRSYRAPDGYANFAEQPGDASELFADADAYGRLRAIKAGYDPDDVFRANHEVAPAR
jgi:hypothetical protein